MKRVIVAVTAVAAVALLSGCANTGAFVAGNMTSVELSEPNYKVVATGVSGQAKAAYVLGISFSSGPNSGSLSLFRVAGTGQLYKEAMDGLWAAYEAEHGPVEGRRLALTNVRYDTELTNLLLYNDLTLSIRADIIEFTE